MIVIIFYMMNIHTYTFLFQVNPPVVLENLQSNYPHEVYVAAANAHGIGDPSGRIIFTTRSVVSNNFNTC